MLIHQIVYLPIYPARGRNCSTLIIKQEYITYLPREGPETLTLLTLKFASTRYRYLSTSGGAGK